MSPQLPDDVLAHRLGFPVGTLGVLIERILASRGARGGRRERVAYVTMRELQPALRSLPAGRYRVACIGSRGLIAGGTSVMETRGGGSRPKQVPARTPREYERTRPPRRVRPTTAPPSGGGEPHPALAECKSLRRKVARRDAQILREREVHDRRERELRAELRTSRASARRADRHRDAAISYAEQQQDARERAERETARARREAATPIAAAVITPPPVREPLPRSADSASPPVAHDAGDSRALEESTQRAVELEAEVVSLQGALRDASDDRAQLVATYEAERAVMQAQMRRIVAAHEEAREAMTRWKRRALVTLTLGGTAAAALLFGAADGAREDVAEGAARTAHPPAKVDSTRVPVAAVGRLTYAGPLDHWRGEHAILQARGGAA